MRESERLGLIREIEDRRGSRVISYITIDRPGLGGLIVLDDLRVLERHLRLCLPRAKKIDLFLYTPGGHAIVPWSLVSMFREFLGMRPFSVLIPSRAYSGGTMIGLGADEIVMSPSGNLGPIDFQMGFGEGSRIGVEDVRAYFKLAQDMGLTSQRDRLHVFSMLASAVHPIIVGDIYRAWSENERLAMLLLGSRKRPLSDKVNKEIANFLMRGVGDHSQAIRRTEARKIGMSFVRDSEDANIDGALTGLFDGYEELLSLDLPFVYSDAFKENADGEVGLVEELGPIALVESTDRLDIAYIKEGGRFWRQPDEAPAIPASQPAPARASFGVDTGAKLALRWQQLRKTDARKSR